MPKRFHLAWFTNFTAGNWSGAFSHGGSPWDGKFFVEFAQAMERACFDYMILEDTLMVSEAWGGTAEMSLSQALQVPKHDPVPLAAMIAAATSRLGIVATMSTLAWPPFMLARVSTTYQLFASWEPGAVAMDRERGIYADWRKVRPVHFEGEFFKCRGPLNTVPSPQRRPTFARRLSSSAM